MIDLIGVMIGLMAATVTIVINKLKIVTLKNLELPKYMYFGSFIVPLKAKYTHLLA